MKEVRPDFALNASSYLTSCGACLCITGLENVQVWKEKTWFLKLSCGWRDGGKGINWTWIGKSKRKKKTDLLQNCRSSRQQLRRREWHTTVDYSWAQHRQSKNCKWFWKTKDHFRLFSWRFSPGYSIWKPFPRTDLPITPSPGSQHLAKLENKQKNH